MKHLPESGAVGVVEDESWTILGLNVNNVMNAAQNKTKKRRIALPTVAEMACFLLLSEIGESETAVGLG